MVLKKANGYSNGSSAQGPWLYLMTTLLMCLLLPLFKQTITADSLSSVPRHYAEHSNQPKAGSK